MRSLLNWIKNYLPISRILVVGALVYILFLQDNSVGQMYDYERVIDSLRTEIQINRDSMLVYQALNQRLDNHDPEIIEQVVRENHNMNRPNEDIYIYE